MFAHRGELTGLWRRKLDGSVTTLVATRGGGIFVGTFGGPAYRLNDSRVGKSQWAIGHGLTQLAATGTDVVGSDRGGLEMLDAQTGNAGWTRDGRFGTAPAIAGDTIYVGGGEKGENGSGFVVAYHSRAGLGSGR